MMRERSRWIAVAAVVAAAILAVVWLRHREAPVRPVLTLRVNRASSAQIAAGTPLTFEIFLTATVTGRPVSIGMIGSPWYRLIRLEPAGKGPAVPWTAAQLGTPRSTLYTKDAQGRPSATSATPQAVATMRGLSAVHVVTLGVSPEDSARTPAGTYQVRAVLSPPWWMFWRWHRTVASAPVTISVSAGPADAGQTHTRLRESAAFYLAASRYADAQQSALAWLQAEPQSSDAYAILGEAKEGLGDAAGAMQAYRYALQLRPPSREPPEYLEKRLSDLMRKTRRFM